MASEYQTQVSGNATRQLWDKKASQYRGLWVAATIELSSDLQKLSTVCNPLRLEDQAAGRQSIGRNGQTTYPYPLLWSDDNALPLQFDTRQRVTGSTDEDRAFFRDRQTIFGGPDNVFTQYHFVKNNNVSKKNFVHIHVWKMFFIGNDSINDINNYIDDKNVKSFNDLQREKFGQLEEKQNKLVEQTEKKLEQMRETVDEKLQKTLNERLGQSFELVGKQLESVQKIGRAHV